MATPRNRAHEFFDRHVAPAMEEWRKTPTDIRLAMNAAVALNHMADHFWHGFTAVDPDRVFNKPTPGTFRAELAERNEHFGLLRDVAEAHISGRADHRQRLWSFVCLEIWWRLFVDRSLKPGDAL